MLNRNLGAEYEALEAELSLKKNETEEILKKIEALSVEKISFEKKLNIAKESSCEKLSVDSLLEIVKKIKLHEILTLIDDLYGYKPSDLRSKADMQPILFKSLADISVGISRIKDIVD